MVNQQELEDELHRLGEAAKTAVTPTQQDYYYAAYQGLMWAINPQGTAPPSSMTNKPTESEQRVLDQAREVFHKNEKA